jgi:hypothetical protein
MNKFIVIAIMALAFCGVTFGQAFVVNDVVKTINLTTTGGTNLTADATIVVPAGERWSLLGVYQGYSTAGKTNTVVVKRILSGLATSTAVTVDTLAAATGSTIESVGEGDKTADIDSIICTEGDTVWLDGSGQASGNQTTYKLFVKRTKQ